MPIETKVENLAIDIERFMKPPDPSLNEEADIGFEIMLENLKIKDNVPEFKTVPSFNDKYEESKSSQSIDFYKESNDYFIEGKKKEFSSSQDRKKSMNSLYSTNSTGMISRSTIDDEEELVDLDLNLCSSNSFTLDLKSINASWFNPVPDRKSQFKKSDSSSDLISVWRNIILTQIQERNKKERKDFDRIPGSDSNVCFNIIFLI